jgi:hypothetical protein
MLAETYCEFNRSMQHHLSESLTGGGVYGTREAIGGFRGAADRDLAALEGGRIVAIPRYVQLIY